MTPSPWPALAARLELLRERLWPEMALDEMATLDDAIALLAAPERETPHPLALLTSREPEAYATLKNHLAHAPLCTATGESYAVRDYCLLDGERAKCDCGLAALLARLAGGDRG